MEFFYIIGFSMACLFALLFTPVVRKIAFLLNIVDQPNHRKVHKKAMPYLGGVAIYGSFSLAYILLVLFTDMVYTNLGIAIVIGGFVVVLTGVLDDKFDIKPRYKVLGQLVATIFAMYLGLRIQYLTIPFTEETIYIEWFGIPLTILWILAITNAINLIDGLDGLASGVSGIAFVALFCVSLMIGNTMTAFTSILLVGAILGFLYFNFYPAKIFMGDSGALFLGYALAVLSLLELKEATIVSFLTPIIILGVPISDTLYAIIRRKLNKKPISSADRNHLHHCLLDAGLSHKNTVLSIYALSIVLSCIAIFLSQSALWISLIILIVYMVAFEILAEAIGLLSNDVKPLISFFASIYEKITFKRK